MGWDWVIYLFIALLVAGTSKKPPQNTPQPGEFDAPTAEEGKGLFVLFGTRQINDPNVVWYGDVEARAIRQRGGKK